jgi:micrococcal nuclease
LGKATKNGLALFSWSHGPNCGNIPIMRKLNRISLATMLVIVLLASVSFAAEPYQAKVVGITDGDTVKVLHEGTQVKIRLYGIDTPEKRQAFGNRAKQFTAGRVAGKVVTIIPMDRDRYGRTVALIQSQDVSGTLNEDLVRYGYAWVYRKYCKADFCPDWLTLEQSAKASGFGLWADPNPIPPWQFRKK